MNIFALSRDNMMRHARNELICTIASKGVPITIPVLISHFREDTDYDIGEISRKLGFVSIQSFLQSEELDDIIVSDYTDKALGSGGERVLCFSIKSDNIPPIKHVLSSIDNAKNYKAAVREEKDRRMRVLLGDPKFRANVLLGKQRILLAIRDSGDEGDLVSLLQLRNKYMELHKVELAKEELKKYFQKRSLKSIIENILFDDIDLLTDENETGSQFYRLKRPYDEIIERDREVILQRSKHYTKKPEAKQLNLVPLQVKKKKAAPPSFPDKKKEKIPPPSPKEKKRPVFVRTVTRSDNFFTDDPLLAHRFGRPFRPYLSDKSMESANNSTLGSSAAEDKKSNPKYTARAEGGTFTDNEEDSDDNDDDNDGTSSSSISESDAEYTNCRLLDDQLHTTASIDRNKKEENRDDLFAVDELFKQINEQVGRRGKKKVIHELDTRLRFDIAAKKMKEKSLKINKGMEQFETEARGRKVGFSRKKRVIECRPILEE